MLASACPHDCGPGDDRDFTSRCPRALQFATQLADDRRLRFVSVDDRVDELKELGARCRTLHGNNTNPLMTDHNLIPLADIEKLHRTSGTFFSVNRNRAVHHGWLNFDLLAIASNQCLLVGCHIEIVRENSVCRGLCKLRIRALGNLRPLLSQAQD